MKHQTITLLFIVLMSMFVAEASAHDIEVKNADNVTIYYVWTNNNTEFAVSYGGWSYNDYNNEYSGNVAIPESVEYNGSTYNVTSIGGSAFAFCSGLTSVTIPESVTSIGERAFVFCSSLTSVTIPESMTSIGESAFQECSGLISVYIYDITAWCNIKFKDVYSNPLQYAHHLYLDGKEVKDLVIPNSVTSIGSSAFGGCSGLTSVTIPNSVTSIGGGAFGDCSGLTTVTIPNSVTFLGNGAFSGCSGLTSVTIGNSVTSINHSTFAYCESLESVTIPNSVTSIGGRAFWGCTGLTSVTIPNSVTSIGNNAFCECSGLTSVTIPESVTSIGYGAFAFCRSLTSVTIPNSVTYIGDTFLKGCRGLTSITIPNSVISIGYEAFSECTGLTSVTIPNSVTSIDRRAFEGADIPTIISLIENPFKIEGKSSDSRAFSQNTFNNATLYVPKGTIDKYKATEGWKDFVSIVEGIPASMTGIPANAVMIQNEGGTITVQGCDEGEQVFVYNTNGIQVGSSVSKNGAAIVSTGLQPGSIVIVKMGEKSFKVLVK